MGTMLNAKACESQKFYHIGAQFIESATSVKIFFYDSSTLEFKESFMYSISIFMYH